MGFRKVWSGSFSPRSKSAHKSLKIPQTKVFGGLLGMFSVSSVTANGEKVPKNGTEKSATKKGDYGLQKAFCGGRVWHLFLAILGGLMGYAAITVFREWRLRREARKLETKR